MKKIWNKIRKFFNQDTIIIEDCYNSTVTINGVTHKYDKNGKEIK